MYRRPPAGLIGLSLCVVNPLAANRLFGAVLLVTALTPLLLAARLTPDARGLGTHEKLGLPACGFHEATGFPCATCGMTTAFSYAAHGRLLAAALTQPAGALLSLLCAVLVLVGGWAVVSGMSLRPLATIAGRPAAIWTGIALLVAAWGYTILVQLI